MKKFLSLLLVIMIFCSVTSFAIGEPSGKIYGTDIVTYMYYAPVTSYNIGGKTCIDAEILNWHYGFDVYWYEDVRRLEITDKGGRFVSGQSLSGELLVKDADNPGKIVGNYYSTDIITLLNGKEIESYNIGGRTVIVAEEMAHHGYNVVWNPVARTLTIDKKMDFYKYDTPYGRIETIHNYPLTTDYVNKKNTDMIIYDADNNAYTLGKANLLLLGGFGISYISLSDFAKLFNGRWTLNREVEKTDSLWYGYPGSKYERYKYTLDFSYDPSIRPDMSRYVVAPGSTDGPVSAPPRLAYNILEYVNFTINGEPAEIRDSWGGRVFPSNFYLHDGEVYIPYNVVRELLFPAE